MVLSTDWYRNPAKMYENQAKIYENQARQAHHYWKSGGGRDGPEAAKRQYMEYMRLAKMYHKIADKTVKAENAEARKVSKKIASAVPRLAKAHNNTAAREHAKYAPGGPGYLAAKKHYESLARGPAAAPQTIRQRMGPESDKKTNTGRKNADGRTIWRGPRGGAFVMKNGRKVPV